MQLALPFSLPVLRLFGAAAPARARVTRRFAAQVRQGDTREISAPPGRVTVHCREGEAWITHDGDPRDVFLAPQQSYLVDCGGRMTLHALRGDCLVEVQVDERTPG